MFQPREEKKVKNRRLIAAALFAAVLMLATPFQGATAFAAGVAAGGPDSLANVSGSMYSLAARMSEVGAGEGLRSLSLGPGGGWVVVGNRNYYYKNAPATMLNKIREAVGGGESLLSASFDERGGWVVVGNQNVYYSYNVSYDSPLRQTVRRMVAAGESVRSVSLGPAGTWIVVGDRHFYNSADVPAEVVSEMRQVGAEEGLMSATFDAFGRWVVVGREHVFKNNIG